MSQKQIRRTPSTSTGKAPQRTALSEGRKTQSSGPGGPSSEGLDAWMRERSAQGPGNGIAMRSEAATPITRVTVHPKLRINAPGDRFEQEADRVADSFVEGRAVAPSNAGETRPETIMRAPSDAGVSTSAGAAEGIMRAVGTHGSPLPDGARGELEGRLGADLSGVRLHTGAAAAESAGAINARAYTLGQHIIFNDGEYAPGTRGGDHLLAHEVTHTVQQGAAGVTVQRKPDEDANPDLPDELSGDYVIAFKPDPPIDFSNDKGSLDKNEPWRKEIVRQVFKQIFKVTDEAQLAKLSEGARYTGTKQLPDADGRIRITIHADKWSEGFITAFQQQRDLVRARNADSYMRTDPEVTPGDQLWLEESKAELSDYERLEQLYLEYDQLRLHIPSFIERTPEESERLKQRDRDEILELQKKYGYRGDVMLNPAAREGFFRGRLRREGSPGQSPGFDTMFEVYARSLAFRMLDDSERTVILEAARYGSKESFGFRELRRALSERNRVRSLSDEPSDEEAGNDVDDISEAQEHINVRKTMLGEDLLGYFPILADPKIDLEDLVGDDDEEVFSAIWEVIHYRMEKIEEARTYLNEDRTKIWDLSSVVFFSKQALGVDEEDAVGRRIDRELRLRRFEDATLSLFLAIFSLLPGGRIIKGLQFVGNFVGLYNDNADLNFEEVMSQTAFDPRMALIDEEPSRFWFIIDFIFALEPLAKPALKAARKLGALWKTASVIDKTIGKAMRIWGEYQIINRVLKRIEGPLSKLRAGAIDLEQFERDVRDLASKLADELKLSGNNATSFVNYFTETSKYIGRAGMDFDRSLLGSVADAIKLSERAAQIKKAAPFIDDVIAVGLEKLNPRAVDLILQVVGRRAKPLSQMLLQHIAVLGQNSPSFKAGLEILSEGLPHDDDFIKVVKSILLDTNAVAPTSLIDALHLSGTKAEDVKRIVTELVGEGGRLSGTQARRKLLPTLESKIIKNLGEGNDLVQNFGKMTTKLGKLDAQRYFRKLVETTTSMNIDRWNTPAALLGLGSKYGSYVEVLSKIESFRAVAFDAFEGKLSTAFTDSEIKRLQMYKELIDRKVEHRSGRKFEAALFAFASQEMANVNRGVIEKMFGNQARIIYLGLDGTMKILR